MTQKMRCYYEVLEIERTATSSEIKSSYYKLARKHHPDKNVGNEEEAEHKFKEIQSAYEILSDPNEKAWYDSHREQILNGGADLEGGDSMDSSINLWSYFSRSVFTDFSDKEGAFYQVYASVFSTLATEECAADGVDINAPFFGHSKSEFGDVRRFYGYWCDFVTKKSFTWHDKYQSSSMTRQIRRLAEKENKKERDKGRKAFVALVRNLALRVKKLDPRVQADLKQQEALRLEREAAAADAAKARAAEREAKKEEMLARHNEFLDELNMKEFDVDEEDLSIEESLEDEFYCEVCKKVFRSEKQWNQHERSNSHKKKLQLLKSAVTLDDDIESTLAANESRTMKNVELEHSRDDEENENNVTESRTEDKPLASDSLSDEDGPEDEEDDSEGSLVALASQKSNLFASLQIEEEEEEEQELVNDSPNSSEEVLSQANKAKLKKEKKKAMKKRKLKDFTGSHVSEALKSEDSQSSVISTQENFNSDHEETPSSPSSASQPQITKKQKRKLRKEAKAQREVVSPQMDEDDGVIRCGICRHEFPTRNQLFKHINKTGHAVLKK